MSKTPETIKLSTAITVCSTVRVLAVSISTALPNASLLASGSGSDLSDTDGSQIQIFWGWATTSGSDADNGTGDGLLI